MTNNLFLPVVPAQAGIQKHRFIGWIPGSALTVFLFACPLNCLDIKEKRCFAISREHILIVIDECSAMPKGLMSSAFVDLGQQFRLS
jgi:hypothetical protein